MANASLPSVQIAVTPRFDVFYALYSLSSAGPSPFDSWKEVARRRLPADFDLLARRVAPLPIFWPLLADAAGGVSGEISFDELLDTLERIPVEDLQRNILGGIFHDAASVAALVSRRRTLRSLVADEDLPGGALLEHFGLRPFDQSSPAGMAIVSLLTKPETFREDLVLLLRRFWETGFGSDWAVIEPRLRVDAERMSELRDNSTLADLARSLNMPLAFDDRSKTARPRNGSPIEYGRIDRCYIVASAFNNRRWWTKYETADKRMTLYLPIVREPGIANSILEAQRPVAGSPLPRPELNAEAVFRALGDTTRYAIASILARTPTSSADLARSLHVSKPTISHHVQALRAAGLVWETPDGGSTRLSLREDTLAALSEAAVQQLFASIGKLPLATTRKRRGP
jgi:DNA-binding transcriptional ArsR family regulator